jgi:hypothetical protein
MVRGNQCIFSSYAQSYKDKSPKPEPRGPRDKAYPHVVEGRSQDFTYPTTTTPPYNAAGTVVDNHPKSNKTSIAFW